MAAVSRGCPVDNAQTDHAFRFVVGIPPGEKIRAGESRIDPTDSIRIVGGRRLLLRPECEEVREERTDPNRVGGMSRRKQARPSRAHLEEDLVQGPLLINPIGTVASRIRK